MRVVIVKPLFLGEEQEEFSAVCRWCVHEKNAHLNGQAWAPGETLDDVTVRGRMPLADDLGWIVCARGHRRLVLREGREPALNFR
jgi:hypothetical protein